jgi:branched-chain amino acid transport system ATP-binding protein
MLELQHVTAGYGGATVLRDVSIVVPDATVVALLGPNGAGKSTTLRVASGLLRPEEGVVALDGVDVTRKAPHDRVAQGLCHVPEGRGIFPSLSVRENLVLSSPKGREADSIERAVAVFPVLGRRLRQVAGTLSGGEQQMLALSRAYVADPTVVLVDEASLGLAPLVVDSIFDFLERLARENAALLIVEQYVTRALALASTIYVLNQGEIVYSGASEGLDEDAIFEMYAGVSPGGAPAAGPGSSPR